MIRATVTVRTPTCHVKYNAIGADTVEIVLAAIERFGACSVNVVAQKRGAA